MCVGRFLPLFWFVRNPCSLEATDPSCLTHFLVKLEVDSQRFHGTPEVLLNMGKSMGWERIFWGCRFLS